MSETRVNDPLAPDRSWTSARVGVLGLGRSGRAAVRLLSRRGVRVLAFDDRESWDERPAELGLAGVEGRLGSSGAEAVAELQTLVVSPGVAPTHPLVRAAEERGLPVIGELELASRLLRGPVVAVTGTNGKSTTVSLVHACLRAAGRASILAGNIGTPVCDVVEEAADDAVVVLEVSSFQLERIRHFHPTVATLLNVAPDHLNRYPDVEAYAAAKRNLLVNVGPTDHFVLPAGDPRAEGWATQCAARPLRFSLDAPQEEGAWIEGGSVVRRWAGRTETVLPTAELPLLGSHNHANVCAALATCLPFALPAPAVAEGLRNFRSLPHRCQLAAEHEGVRWVDDSKATNVHAATASLAGLPGPVILLLGGAGKGEDYAPLRAFLGAVKTVICYGDEGERIAEALQGAATLDRRPTLRAAFERARELADAGDTVLLSPACASFDEFANFEERGSTFARWAREEGGTRP